MPFKFNPITGNLDLVGATGAGTGDVVGPSGATDTAIARYDGTTGKLIQDSKAYVQDGGAVEAQAFVGRKEIDDAVVLPPKHYMIASGLTIMATGSITISSDSEVILT